MLIESCTILMILCAKCEGKNRVRFGNPNLARFMIFYSFVIREVYASRVKVALLTQPLEPIGY